MSTDTPTPETEPSTEGHECPSVKPEAPMSWEQCFERAAQEDYGRPAEEVKQLYAISTYAEDLYERAAELYARSKCREQREICVQSASIIRTNGGVPCIDEGSILYAPAPQFKA